MKYYLITIEEFNANHADCLHSPAYSLDGSKCVIEVEDSEVVENFIESFENGKAVNAYRYAETEASNWIPTEEF